jgi:hypothetical protein
MNPYLHKNENTERKVEVMVFPESLILLHNAAVSKREPNPVTTRNWVS